MSSTPPPAPIFHPTYDEWKDFAAYVRKIEPQIARYGGCQIVPPPEWKHTPLKRRPERFRTTSIKPIRQHVAGGNGRFQALMELCDPQPLERFIGESETLDQQAGTLPGAVDDPAELDARFWRSAAAKPSPHYGADSSEAGSLFDPDLQEWNLGRLPGGVDHDLTQHLPMALPGLNRSMLYFGQWRSFFALHTEDCELQGASYLHWGAPKRWYVVPPSHASRVRQLAAAIWPELRRECAQFLRHKTTLISPSVLKASNIPCHSVLQTEGTFVVVLSSAYHFGYNQGANCAEAVNFGLGELWLPAARLAQPCTCDGQQTPHIELPLLIRRLKADQPHAAKDVWCFACSCGETSTSFDAADAAPTGEQFECTACACWGHVECYPELKNLKAAGLPLPERLYCVSCRDAWLDETHADDAWSFTCVCGRNEGASNVSAAVGEAPTGRMFQCDGCSAWSHTECYAEYEGIDDDELPPRMFCHRCAPGKPTRSAGPASSGRAADGTPRLKQKAKQSVAKGSKRAATAAGGAAATPPAKRTTALKRGAAAK